MSKLIPERPRYHRERLIVGFAVLAVFALLFLSRLLFARFFPSASFWFVLIPMGAGLLLPSLVFIGMRGKNYKRALRLHPPRPSHIPFLISAFLALLAGCMLLSMPFGGTEHVGSSAASFERFTYSGTFEMIAMIVLLAILPALLEELFFRGIVMAEYERRGAVRAVLMSALLFAFCHFDLPNLPVYLFSGAILALVLFATDSLIATMLLHICYNVFSLFGQPYLNAFYRITGGVEIFVFSLILILLLSLIIFFSTGSRIYHIKDRGGRKDPRRDVPRNVQFYTILDALCDPPILLCIALTVVSFFVL